MNDSINNPIDSNNNDINPLIQGDSLITNNSPITSKSLITNQLKAKGAKKRRLSHNQELAIKSQIDLGVPPIKIAAIERISTSTVYNVVKNKRLEILKNDELDHLKSAMISKTYSNALTAQHYINDDKLEKATFVQLMVGSKIGIEMARLMEERSTANVNIKSVNQLISDEYQSLSEKIASLDSKLYPDNKDK